MSSLIQRLALKLIVPLHNLIYRLSKGRIGSEMWGVKVLLLSTVGRKSGKSLTAPLGYFEHEGAYVLTASNGGAPNNPAWYHNLMAHPRVTVQVKERVIYVEATEAQEPLRSELWAKLITQAPIYAGYERRTTRKIPMLLLKETLSR